MAVSLDTGIEKISYQSHGVNLKGDFPLRKVYLLISASIPSHTEEVFNLYASNQLIERSFAPKIPNKYVTAPSNYTRLFQEIETISNNQTPKNNHERQVVQAAQVLFTTMKDDFQSFNVGRNALIQG